MQEGDCRVVLIILVNTIFQGSQNLKHGSFIQKIAIPRICFYSQMSFDGLVRVNTLKVKTAEKLTLIITDNIH